MKAYSGNKDQCTPVVHLTHDESTSNVEADVQRRSVCDGHLSTLERCVAAVVIGVSHGGLVEEGQPGSGDDDHHKGPHGHFTEHEAPVVWEYLAGEELGETTQS